MSRILAIDYGERKCGLAVTDPLLIAAHPLDVVASIQLETFLTRYFEEESVSKLVFGKPTHADGNTTHIWPKILKMSASLKKSFPQLEIDFQDENFTSAEARAVMLRSGMKKSKRRNKENVDLISAVIILQRYLGHI